MLMCIQNLVKFCPLVLKILSGNEMVTELRNNGMTEGQGKSNIAPLFHSGAIKMWGGSGFLGGLGGVGLGGGGVRVDVNEELMFLQKLKKKKLGGWGGLGGGGRGRVGGVRVDVNEELKFL